MASLYLDLNVSGGSIDVYLNEEDRKVLAGFFTKQLRAKMSEGIEVHPSPDVSKGFRVSLRDHGFYHDFTREAIAEEMCKYLQPRIQEIIRKVVDEKEQ